MKKYNINAISIYLKALISTESAEVKQCYQMGVTQIWIWLPVSNVIVLGCFTQNFKLMVGERKDIHLVVLNEKKTTKKKLFNSDHPFKSYSRFSDGFWPPKWRTNWEFFTKNPLHQNQCKNQTKCTIPVVFCHLWPYYKQQTHKIIHFCNRQNKTDKLKIFFFHSKGT